MRRALLAVLAAAAGGAALVAGGRAGTPSVSVRLEVTPLASPNGDGVKDSVSIVAVLGAPASLTVTVDDSGGTVVAALAAAVPSQAGQVHLRWEGRRDAGGTAGDGVYTIEAQAVAADGTEATASAQTRIDTRAPKPSWRSVHAEPGSGPLRASYRVSDAEPTVELALLLRARSGDTWVASRRTSGTGSYTAGWTLRGPGGARLQPGAFRVRLRATDGAANTGFSSWRSILVEYPVATRVVRRVDAAHGLVALTFDDCNDGVAWTSILRTLEARRLQATFFCLGPEVARHLAQARDVLRDGDAIGNHTWTHPYLPRLSSADVRSQVRRSTRVWWNLARVAPLPYFRPPYGALSQTALGAIGSEGYSTVVLWDVDPQDWRRPGVGAIVERAAGPARSGSIVLLHVLPQTAAALPEIIARVQAKGLRPVTIDRLLAAAHRGVQAAAGVAISSGVPASSSESQTQSRVTNSQKASPAHGL